jgi:hypothetical protein
MRCLPTLMALLVVMPLMAAASDHRGGHSSGSSHASPGSGSSHSRGAGPTAGSHAPGHPTPAAVHQPGRHRAEGVQRDSHGRIERDPAQRARFERTHPCPSTGRTAGACPGYVVDHIQALKHGGADRPENMQWQTVREGKQKDRWE